MNMRAQLSDEQLLAQRQARTGRAVSSSTPASVDAMPDPGVARQTVPVRAPFNFDAPAEGDAAPLNFTQQPADGGHNTATQTQQELAAALGRLGPMQQQLEQYRASAEQLRAANAKLQADLQAQQAGAMAEQARKAADAFDPFEGMSADELAMMDPVVIDAMRRTARAALAKATQTIGDPRALIAQTLQERDALAVKGYITSVSQELQLAQLGEDPAFQQFVREDGSADMLLNSFLRSTDMSDAQTMATRVRTMLKRYNAGGKGGARQQNPDPQDRLSAHMSRSAQPAAHGTDGQPHSALTPARMADIRKQAAALSRNRKHAEAAALLAKLS